MNRVRPGTARTARRETADVQIVGCGRTYWSDDQIGLRVAGLLARNPPPRTEVTSAESSGVDVIAGSASASLLVIVDAARTAESAETGRIRRFVLHSADLPSSGGGIPALQDEHVDSCHGFGVHHALELAAALGTLPPEVWVYAVAARSFEPDADASAFVQEISRLAANQIRADLAAWRSGRSVQRA